MKSIRHGAEGAQNMEDEVSASAEVQVFYVDFGNTEWVSVGELRPLLAKFMQLPGQVLKCSLANIQPGVCWEDVFVFVCLSFCL